MMLLDLHVDMFVGFGTLSGGAHKSGQEIDRTAFQLVTADKLTYRPRQCRASLEVFGRKPGEGKWVGSDEKTRQF